VESLVCDIVILTVTLLSFIVGWVRGATKEILAIISWVGGVYLTVTIFPHARGFVRDYIKHGLIADFVTVCGLFVALLTVFSVVNHLCLNVVKESMLKSADKVLGGMFGIIRGIAILAVVDIVLSQCFNETPELIRSSKLRPTVSGIANVILLLLPDSVQCKVVEHMSQIRKQSFLDFIKNNVIGEIAAEAEDHSIGTNAIASYEAHVTDDATSDTNSAEEAEVSGVGSEAGSDNNLKQREQTARDLAKLEPKRNPSSSPSRNVDTTTTGAPREQEMNDMNRVLDSIMNK
jgi:membrane protein required for colicin V production